ncbi:MAG: selenide, water dikinase SelD, partial [Minicystis sp.]
LGIGIITTAAKQEKDDAGAIREAIRLMSTLNRAAGEAMCAVGVHAATDITGFGLLGHLRNIVVASGCTATVWLDRVPVIDAALRYVREGIVPGGTHANWRFLGEHTTFAEGVDKEAQLVLSDAQTSGGMLIAVEPGKLDQLLDALRERGTPCADVIGRLDAGSAGRMQVVARAP